MGTGSYRAINIAHTSITYKSHPYLFCAVRHALLHSDITLGLPNLVVSLTLEETDEANTYLGSLNRYPREVMHWLEGNSDLFPQMEIALEHSDLFPPMIVNIACVLYAAISGDM